MSGNTERVKVVIPGGTGHVGQSLTQFFQSRGDEVVIVSRSGPVSWDGKSVGPWADHLEGSDVVINLAGRSVNCRYTPDNLDDMMTSRVDSTRAVGEVIAACKNPPKVWLQASTATIYAHRLDAPNDDETGMLGSQNDPMPSKWLASVEIAKAWEAALEEADTSHTRKVALRSSMVMAPIRDSIFDVLSTLAKRGLAGRAGSGKQYVSWIHESDFCRAIQWIIDHDDLGGPIIVASPNPLPQAEFNAGLRKALGVKFGLPTPAFLLEVGAAFMGTETELVLKSRRVVPSRLLASGFTFDHPNWCEAAADLASRRT